MKRIFICIWILLAMTACHDGDTVNPEPSSQQPSRVDSPAAPEAEAHPAETVSSFEKLPLTAYDAFSEAMDGRQPSLEEMAAFLALQIRAYEDWTMDGYELWSFERPGDPYVIPNTQLVTCKVPQANNAVLYYGVDRTNGHLFRWEEGCMEAARRIDNLEQFATPQSAANYIGDRFGETSKLELVVENEEQYILRGYEDSWGDEQWGHPPTSNWYYVHKNGFISDFFENRYLAMPNDPVPQRAFYRYAVEDAVWVETADAFPAGWMEAAKNAVRREREEESSFSRGWLYDFAGDGQPEAILLLAAQPTDDNWFAGSDHYVFVNAAGEATYLMSGSDWSLEEEDGLWRHLDSKILHYDGFRHVVLRSGNLTAAGGNTHTIYTVKGGKMIRLFPMAWLNVDNDVFLESRGPQGQGPAFHFWDSHWERYSTIAPVEIPPEAFFEMFEAGDAVISNEQLEFLAEHGVAPAQMTVAQVAQVDVYGKRYYNVILKRDNASDPYAVCWMRREDGSWELFSQGVGFLESLSTGDVDVRYAVHDVDMNEAELAAHPSPQF